MRILITGISGFIGSRFAKWVRSKHPGVAVYGVDDLSGGYIENVPADAYFHKCRLGCGGTLERTLEGVSDLDVVFHFAAYAAECLSPFIRRFNYENNLVGTAEVVNYCINHQIRRLVFTSSIAVYGDSQKSVLTEDDPPCPMDPYGVAKMACEHDIKIAGVQHGLEWCIVRPHNVYGPGQNIWDRYRNVLGIWMREAYCGRPIVVFGDGEQQRQFTFIDDILPPLWAAGTGEECSGLTANLGSNDLTSLVHLAELVGKITGAEVVFADPRHEARCPTCCHHRSRRYLGCGVATAIEDGVSEMWEWVTQAMMRYPSRVSPAMPREIERGVYSQWR